MEKLEEVKNNVRFQLGKKLNSKYVPKINFFYDKSILNADKISKIFNKLEN